MEHLLNETGTFGFQKLIDKLLSPIVHTKQIRQNAPTKTLIRTTNCCQCPGAFAGHFVTSIFKDSTLLTTN